MGSCFSSEVGENIKERRKMEEKEEMEMEDSGDSLGKKMKREGEEDADNEKEKEMVKQMECGDGKNGSESSSLETKMLFEDLPQDCLMEVLEWLSPANLMKMAQVNKQMNKLVEIKLGLKIKKVVAEKSRWKSLIEFCELSDFAENEIVHLDSMFARMRKSEVADKKADDFYDTPAKDMFLKMLTRFSSVKSIDFGKQELTMEVFKETTRICTEIESIILYYSVVFEKAWNDFFSQVGHKIVRFGWMVKEENPTTHSQILEMIASKCPNIKQVMFLFENDFTSDFIVLLKKLPESCSVYIFSTSVLVPIHDTIDYMCTMGVDLTAFGSFNRRLKKLGFTYLTDSFNPPHFSVEFAALKKLTYLPRNSNVIDFNYLAASRFPKLEEFAFTANNHFIEEDFFNLFQKMPELKKLRIKYLIIEIDEEHVIEDDLPETAILELKKLEQLQLSLEREVFHFEEPAWQRENFIQQLDWYVDKIPTLKLLLIDADEKIIQLIADRLELMKNKQNKVEIDF